MERPTAAPTGRRRLTRETELLGVEAVRAKADCAADWEVYVPVLTRLAAADDDLAAELRASIESTLLATTGVTSAFEVDPGLFGVAGTTADGAALIFAVGEVLDDVADRLRRACAAPP
ncbi:MAG: hypothetical protein IPK07_33170 [Deltaproteobacteria bacterium]|nr:hypothetical protein [Deltaproteobacteria bacterium]